MTQRSLPRYFVSHSGGQSPSRPLVEPLPPAHVIDSFFTGSRHLQEREWVVGVDGLGNLQALPDEDRKSFPESVQSELAYHEISGNSHRRLLEATEVYLFYLQLLEQPAGSPGGNDPIYLYGTLFGPYPGAGGDPAAGIEGQLTVTRGDLLDGLVQGAGQAFRYQNPSGESRSALRCFHLLLPGGTEDEIRRGSGIILAYPLLPPELTISDVSNEMVVSQLVYDLLSAMKEDLAHEQIEHPLRSMTLPVPSRSSLEQQLQTQGYSISGDTAVKNADSGEGFKGLLAAVFGALMNDSLQLPPEGEADEFLELARLTLQALPGWPSTRAVALRDRVKPAPARREVRPAPTPPRTPQLGAPLPPVRITRPVRRNDEPPEWMKDFISAHQQPDAPPPRLTSTTVLKPHTVSTKMTDSLRREPEWLKDFEQPSPAEQPNEAKKQRPSGRPEWMDDFD